MVYYEAGLFRLAYLRVLLHLQTLQNDADPVETGALQLFSAVLNLTVNQELMEALDVADKWGEIIDPDKTNYHPFLVSLTASASTFGWKNANINRCLQYVLTI